jgi:hypothetical protein
MNRLVEGELQGLAVDDKPAPVCKGRPEWCSPEGFPQAERQLDADVGEDGEADVGDLDTSDSDEVDEDDDDVDDELDEDGEDNVKEDCVDEDDVGGDGDTGGFSMQLIVDAATRKRLAETYSGSPHASPAAGAVCALGAVGMLAQLSAHDGPVSTEVIRSAAVKALVKKKKKKKAKKQGSKGTAKAVELSPQEIAEVRRQAQQAAAQRLRAYSQKVASMVKPAEGSEDPGGEQDPRPNLRPPLRSMLNRQSSAPSKRAAVCNGISSDGEESPGGGRTQSATRRLRPQMPPSLQPAYGDVGYVPPKRNPRVSVASSGLGFSAKVRHRPARMISFQLYIDSLHSCCADLFSLNW